MDISSLDTSRILTDYLKKYLSFIFLQGRYHIFVKIANLYLLLKKIFQDKYIPLKIYLTLFSKAKLPIIETFTFTVKLILLVNVYR